LLCVTDRPANRIELYLIQQVARGGAFVHF
jgi:hypothetical protein